MKCPKCDFENPEGMNFCGMCGSPLPRKCIVCGSINEPGAKSCKNCGEKFLKKGKQPIDLQNSIKDYTPPYLREGVLKLKDSLEGERKLVTVLFADVVGFTEIAEILDPEDVRDIMDRCFEILGDGVHKNGGTINQYTGDGIMALFGAPFALENHISRACDAALFIQDELAKLERYIKKTYGISFKMRIGINSGFVVVGAIGDNLRMDYTAVGDTTNLAARLQALAPSGAILVSEKVKTAVEDEFIFKDVGIFKVKGKTEKIRAYILLKRREEKGTEKEKDFSLYSFLDRKEELIKLWKAFRLAKERGPLVAIIQGEAGIGKTALIEEFRKQISDEAFFIYTSCRPYGRTISYHPFSTMFREYFHIGPEDDSNILKKKIWKGLKNKSLFHKLAHLINIVEETRKDSRSSEIIFHGRKRTFLNLLKAVLIGATRDKPIIMVIDNGQWIDPSSSEFLSFIEESTEKIPLLIILSGRENEIPQHISSNPKMISLKPLSRQDCFKILFEVVGTDRLERKILESIIKKAGGNPLFISEVGEMLKNRGLVVCDGKKCTLSIPLNKLDIPDSIYGIISERIDSLPDMEKKIIQVASVIGNEFSHDLLSSVTGFDNISEQLLKLEKKRIIQKISPEKGGTYRFYNMMIKDVVYQSMLKRTRKRLHEMVGVAIKSNFKRIPYQYLDSVSYHFYMAENWKEALKYTLQNAHYARRSYACHEALTCFDRVLDIVVRMGLDKDGALSKEQLVKVFEWRGRLNYCIGDMNRALTEFKVMRERAKEYQLRDMEAEALFRIGWAEFYQHHPKLAEKHLRMALEMGKSINSEEVLIKVKSFLGFLYAVLGKLNEAEPLLKKSIEMAQKTKEPHIIAWPLAYLIQYYNWRAEYQEAIRLSRRLRSLNKDLKSPELNILIHFREGLIYGALGRLRKAERILKQGLTLLEGKENRFWRPRFLNTLGWIYAEWGNTDEAIKLNKQALEEASGFGDHESIQNSLINLGENYLQCSELKKAERILKKSMAQIKKPGIFYVRWRYRTRLYIDIGHLMYLKGRYKKGIYFIDLALRHAKKSGARKHIVKALMIKGLIQREYRPKIAIDTLREAMRLSENIGTQLLTKRIRELLRYAY